MMDNLMTLLGCALAIFGGGHIVEWVLHHMLALDDLAAKGVARYGEIKEAKNQKVAEYVLIGTMISLGWTIVVFAGVRLLGVG
jgi:hypoxanthine phosphoribosyltransferase